MKRPGKAPPRPEADKKRRNHSIPKIEHVHLEFPGEAGSSIEKISVEERGLRKLVLRTYHDISHTLADAEIYQEPSDELYGRLFHGANQILEKGGEKTFMEILGNAQKEGDKAEKALMLWHADIAVRKGRLSPEAMAADFLLASDRIHMRLDGDETILSIVYTFCEAWHWLRMEASGAHALAEAGMKAWAGRAVAAPMATARKKAKAVIIEEAYRSYCQRKTRRPQRTASAAAPAILAHVNKILTEKDLGSYTESSLRKALGPIAKQLKSV